MRSLSRESIVLSNDVLLPSIYSPQSIKIYCFCAFLRIKYLRILYQTP